MPWRGVGKGRVRGREVVEEVAELEVERHRGLGEKRRLPKVREQRIEVEGIIYSNFLIVYMQH
jgi:hypothetical protein